MSNILPITAERLQTRRKMLGIGFQSLASRSGVSIPTVKRIFGGQIAAASFGNIAAIAEALGLSFELGESSVDALCRQQARKKAMQVARLVQGTSALESQAVGKDTYKRMVEKSFREILAGPKRKLWAL
jgi:transcriptional regulator with XRE-family HTH domain